MRIYRAGIILTIFILGATAKGQTLEDEAVSWLQEYITVDTINPPGNEYRAVDFLADIFEAEGIEYQTAESAPGRGNIWARLEGGDDPAIRFVGSVHVAVGDDQLVLGR